MVLENGKITNLMKSKIIPIKGDASSRIFSRVVINKKSKIQVSSKKNKYQNLVAYSAINQLLRQNKILAPKLFLHNIKKGIIVIGDFGNLSFHKVLLRSNNKLRIYKRLVDLLCKIQAIGVAPKIKSIINKPHTLNYYTIKNLHRESDLFFKWYLPILLSKQKTLKVKKRMKKILTNLYKKIKSPNNCFVHRDFHVQNLMQVGKKIGVIDSQDAIIGNRAYDLASLIDDVRIKTTKKLKEEVFNYYIKKVFKKNNFNYNFFSNDFNILSVQRNLKIIGIFSRLYKRDKKKKYLKLIPYAWNLLEMRMKSDAFSELKKILNENISKKKRKLNINK